MGFFFFAVRRVSWQGIYFLLVNEIILPSHEWLCQRLHSTVFVSLNFLDDWVLVLEGWHTGVVLYARNASTTWVRRIFKASVGGVSYRINWRMYVVLISFWQPAWRILYTGRAVGEKKCFLLIGFTFEKSWCLSLDSSFSSYSSHQSSLRQWFRSIKWHQRQFTNIMLTQLS